MNRLEFFLPIVPPKTTSQMKRLVMIGGKPRFFHKKGHEQAQNDLVALMAPHIPESPMEGPVALSVVFVFPWRKSEPKRRLALGKAPMTSKPDCDNAVKLIGDVLTKLRFYNDDAQVAHLNVRKYWGDNVGITIKIIELVQE